LSKNQKRTTKRRKREYITGERIRCPVRRKEAAIEKEDNLSRTKFAMNLLSKLKYLRNIVRHQKSPGRGVN